MKSTFKVLFYLKKGSEKKNGEVMIMARITIDGKLCQFSTKQSIQPDNWSIAAGKAKGRDAGRINALWDDIRSSLNTIYHEMQRRDNYVTAEKVKNEFLGHSESHETILSLFQKHNDDVKQLVGISKTIATYRKYEVTRRHLAEFIQSKYNVSDISIKEISPMFITDFELYLRTACKCGYNTTAKFMQFFKRIIIIARNNGILVGDPFASYKIRLEKVDRGYLTEDEIKIILKKKMVSERLEHVRDLFVFSCFCGLAYSDVANLRQENIQKSFDGNLWIITKRQKTNTDVNVPLLDIPKMILKKYKGKLPGGCVKTPSCLQLRRCYAYGFHRAGRSHAFFGSPLQSSHRSKHFNHAGFRSHAPNGNRLRGTVKAHRGTGGKHRCAVQRTVPSPYPAFEPVETTERTPSGRFRYL